MFAQGGRDLIYTSPLRRAPCPGTERDVNLLAMVIITGGRMPNEHRRVSSVCSFESDMFLETSFLQKDFYIRCVKG